MRLTCNQLARFQNRRKKKYLDNPGRRKKEKVYNKNVYTHMSHLNANAREWRPSGPPMVELPPSTEQPQHYHQQPDPHHTVFVYDSDGEGELVAHDGQFGFDGELEEEGGDPYADEMGGQYHPAYYSQPRGGGGGGGYHRPPQHHPMFKAAFQQAGGAGSATTPQQRGALTSHQMPQSDADTAEDDEYARHAAEFESNTFYIGPDGMPFVPPLICTTQEELAQVDWEAEAQQFMDLQRSLIQKQLDTMREREELIASRIAARQNGGAGAAAAVAGPTSTSRPNNAAAAAESFPPLGAPATGGGATAGKKATASSSAVSSKGTAKDRAAEGAAPNVAPLPAAGAGVVLPPASNSWASVVRGGAPPPTAPSVAPSHHTAASTAAAPLTVNGNHRWKKLTKAQQRQQQAQKQAFESFANSLLHSASPFMEPLRIRCKTSLPHIKVDQRFGKRGVPQSAVAQFVVAPMVVHYRPRHFDEVPPGDILEFHYDFAQVLKAIPTATTISYCYGPEWKPYAIPYCYVSCRDYKQEVLSLCPHEVPNSRSEALYEDDILKDVTSLVLAVEELSGPLSRMSILQCMARRVNLSPMYHAFESVFAPIGNYQIQIRDLDKVPSTFLIKTSKQVLEQRGGEEGEAGAGSLQVVLHGDHELWDALPNVDHSFQSGKGTVAASSNNAAATAAPSVSSSVAVPSRTAAAAPTAAPAAPIASSSSSSSSPSTTTVGGATTTAAAPSSTQRGAAQPQPQPQQRGVSKTVHSDTSHPPSPPKKSAPSLPPPGTVVDADAAGKSGGLAPWVAVGAFSAVCVTATVLVVRKLMKR
jgi:hypothetical protein